MKKKFLIPVIVVILLFTMTITAYATQYSCFLQPNQTGEEKTTALYASHSHYSGSNSVTSTNDMILKYQYLRGTWKTIDIKRVDPNQYVYCSTVYTDPAGYFRTKIYSYQYAGGVLGVGTVFDN